MEILNIDFEKLSPYIIDAFTKVYGDEYHDTISKKINNMHIFYYYNIDNLKEYIADIKMCKRREYAIRFLDKIGIDVKKYIKANYMDPLGEEVEEILKYYISSSFKKSGNKSSSIQQYHINNPNDPEISLANKLLIINHLLENNHEEITIENYERFKETREYQVILSKIKEINLVFNKLLTEYETWEEQLQPYDDFIDSEIERKLNILNDKKVATFNNIYAKLPISIKDAISNKTLEGQITSIFGSLDFGSSTPIEAFSSKNMEKLKSKNVNAFKRFLILSSQILYLKNIGIAIENYNLLTNSIDEIINKYLNFITEDNIKKYIPSSELIEYITSLREKNYEAALREYYLTTDNLKGQCKNERIFNYVYSIVVNQKICVAGNDLLNNDGEFCSLMFYAISSCGCLFYLYIHECGHVIDKNEKGCGFELISSYDDNPPRNSYDNKFRKYEKFNETLNDIFTSEAVELLHNQGIYLIEPQEFTLRDVSNTNTSLLTKNILKPLLSKFRKEVIRAKITADPNKLIKYIGKDNYEDLVDVVNKIDYLARNGVEYKINTSPDDEMVKEYFIAVENAKNIYLNIDTYYSNLELESNQEKRKNR